MITYDNLNKTFTLDSKNTTYQMMICPDGHLQHLYFGKYLYGGNTKYAAINYTISHNIKYFTKEYCYMPNLNLQEYSSFGTGDFSTPCIHAIFEDGSQVLDLIYQSHIIYKGKIKLNGLPATYFSKENAETLEIVLRDRYKDIEIVMMYTVSNNFNGIIRSTKIINKSQKNIYLESALSCCLDFRDSNYEFVSFGGRALLERMINRTKLTQGKISVGSIKGISSHSSNPFSILCREETNENIGECYGISLLYSGNFITSVEVSGEQRTRLSVGINPEGFLWKLSPDEDFQTPEVILGYSAEGFGPLSIEFHTLYKESLCRGYYKNHRRPVLINSWEAFLYDFTTEKLVSLAKESAKCGIELLVLDDGWFGKRNNDDCSLGDWNPNEDKLQGTLKELVDKINLEGLKFGLWFEPEMISKNSILYRNHPDWCLHCPEREPGECRSQLVLDMSRKDVQDYIYNKIYNVLNSANVEYVKWDMNRPLSDVYSVILPSDKQGEVYHKFVLGTYSLLERLIEKFPKVLFEGCSSGGGRFDAGMLYYTPQIWCSDNTEPSDRTIIQYNTSFGYPMSSISAHVSCSPNIQTGRESSLKTRGIVAMTGSFGYEMDIRSLSIDEKQMIKEQIEFYKKSYDLIYNGNYYRLTNPYGNNVVSWQYLSKDGSKALIGVFWYKFIPNSKPVFIKVRNLEPKSNYKVVCDRLWPFVINNENDIDKYCGFIETKPNIDSVNGSVLMNFGLGFRYFKEQNVSFFIEITKIND